MKILVVDDNPSHLKLAHHVLDAAGFNVNGVEAAEKAMECIKEDKPDLILLDVELPGMDGLALVKKLKAVPETRDIPVVAVTSYPERYPRAAMLAAGCEGYIQKPIDTRMLPAQLGSLMK